MLVILVKLIGIENYQVWASSMILNLEIKNKLEIVFLLVIISLKCKTEVLENVEYFTKFLKTQFNKNIKVIRSDNSSEFLKNNLKTL